MPPLLQEGQYFPRQPQLVQERPQLLSEQVPLRQTPHSELHSELSVHWAPQPAKHLPFTHLLHVPEHCESAVHVSPQVPSTHMPSRHSLQGAAHCDEVLQKPVH